MSQFTPKLANSAENSNTRRRSVRKPADFDTVGTSAENLFESNSYSFTMSSRKLKICAVVFIVLIGISSLVAVIALKKSKDSNETCLDFTPEKFCSSKLKYNFFGTKTDYLAAREEIKEEPESKDKNDCEAQQFYIFSRHAIRYPDADKIAAMMDKLPDLRNRILNASTHDPICEKLQHDLRNWTISMHPKDDNKLSESGKNQSRDLGARFKARFPALLSENLSTYEFGFTTRDRTLDTAIAFAKGIFIKDLKNDIQNFGTKDSILQFHKECDDILKKKGWKKSKHKETTEFQNGKIMTAVLQDISQRFGMDIDFDTFKMILSICQFETTILGNSPWCPLFKPVYIKVFEYLDDLDDYYADSYGKKRNYEQACPMVQHLLEKFSSAKAGQGSNPKAVLMFSHAGAIKKVITRFGLFEDKHSLKAEKFCSSENRKWRSSFISPFNSNLVFVLYKCSRKYYVETLLQEKRVIVKGCKSSFCPWDDFEDKYKKIAKNCDLNEICSP